MILRRVAIYSYWRTGSTLLSNILMSNGYIYYDEYYSKIIGTLKNKNISNDVLQELIHEYNRYFLGLHDINMAMVNYKHRVSSVVKIMTAHHDVVSDEVEKIFTDKIFLYRKNALDVVISKIVAQTIGQWTNVSVSNLVQKKQIVIDTEEFQKEIRLYLNDQTNFLNSTKVKFDCVVYYDPELTDYIKKTGVNYVTKKTAPTDIVNIDQIKEIYNNYTDEIEQINSRVKELHDNTNTDFQSYIQGLTNEKAV